MLQLPCLLILIRKQTVRLNPRPKLRRKTTLMLMLLLTQVPASILTQRLLLIQQLRLAAGQALVLMPNQRQIQTRKLRRNRNQQPKLKQRVMLTVRPSPRRRRKLRILIIVDTSATTVRMCTRAITRCLKLALSVSRWATCLTTTTLAREAMASTTKNILTTTIKTMKTLATTCMASNFGVMLMSSVNRWATIDSVGYPLSIIRCLLL